MPIYNPTNINKAPEWVDISAFGVAHLDKGDSVELHYHDAEEYWFVVDGKARVSTEGTTSVVKKGDVVCTKMGDEHQIIEVFDEGLTMVFVESRLKGKKRPGHLHRE